MIPTDWKDALNNLLPADKNETPDPAPEPGTKGRASSVQRNPLVVRFEKRNGKPTTIISRFEGNTDALQQLASDLKKHCSAGGSAKDDEILIQGDVRTKLATFLEKKGYTIKGDIKKITGSR